MVIRFEIWTSPRDPEVTWPRDPGLQPSTWKNVKPQKFGCKSKGVIKWKVKCEWKNLKMYPIRHYDKETPDWSARLSINTAFNISYLSLLFTVINNLRINSFLNSKKFKFNSKKPGQSLNCLLCADCVEMLRLFSNLILALTFSW